jgi:hypothetical protein
VVFPDPGLWLHNGQPPHPHESVEIAIVGGGISGLAAAYMLRQFRPVVFDNHPRFGGNAAGEYWNGVPYSLGGAYVITPDKGSLLESFYQELGLHHVYRLDDGQQEVELNGTIQVPREFWAGAGLPREEQAAFAEYTDLVTTMAEKNYPEIPLPEGRDNQWIIDLDTRTLREDIEAQLTHPVPALLAAAIQAYCYSSFGAGWEEISAASGWNFVAAEEFGRWVFRGGNATMAWKMWRALAADDDPSRRQLRPGSMVVDVRLHPTGRVQVTYLDQNRSVRSLLAKRVVMACSKHVCKYILPDLERLDPDKLESMNAILYAAYVVANVLLEAPIERDFYDIFLLGKGTDFPQSAPEAAQWAQVCDLLNGRFTYGPEPGPRSVLTLYWPLPWAAARFTLFEGKATLVNYATNLVPQLQEMLALLDVKPPALRQVRLSYWGHAMPIARPFFIADGHAERVRRPIEGLIWFIQQDNWALPAVENSLLDAATFVPELVAGL